MVTGSPVTTTFTFLGIFFFYNFESPFYFFFRGFLGDEGL